MPQSVIETASREAASAEFQFRGSGLYQHDHYWSYEESGYQGCFAAHATPHERVAPAEH